MMTQSPWGASVMAESWSWQIRWPASQTQSHNFHKTNWCSESSCNICYLVSGSRWLPYQRFAHQLFPPQLAILVETHIPGAVYHAYCESKRVTSTYSYCTLPSKRSDMSCTNQLSMQEICTYSTHFVVFIIVQSNHAFKWINWLLLKDYEGFNFEAWEKCEHKLSTSVEYVSAGDQEQTGAGLLQPSRVWWVEKENGEF